MTPLLLPVCLIAAISGPASPAPDAHAPAEPGPGAVRVTLIDGSLRTRAVRLVRLDASARGGTPAQCVFLDDSGTLATIAADGDPAQFPLAIAPEDWAFADPAELASTDAASAPPPPGSAAQPNPPASVIELADGRRLVGSLATGGREAAAGPDQFLRWNHPRLGVQSIPLDQVRGLRLAAPATSEARAAIARQEATAGVPESDVVLLANGDRLTGFVEEIGGASGEVVVTPASAPGVKAQPVRVPLAQTAFIVLANPAVHPSGIMLWLADGSVVTTDRLEFDAAAGRVTLGARTPAPPSPAPGASLDLADLRAVALDASRLTPLSSLGIAGFAPTGDRRIAEPPRVLPVAAGVPSPLGADDVVLPGPMTVEWELPARATRLAGWITLESSALAWGDCTVSIGLVEPGHDEPSAALVRRRVFASEPVFPVNIELPAQAGKARLRVTVDAGPSGPIQDRVRLRRMLVVSGPPAH